MSALTTAQRVGRRHYRIWAKERIEAVLESDLDASGASDPQQEVVVVAGFGASEDEWDHWERQWLAMLAGLELERWHHSHFLNRRGEFENWPDAKFVWAEGLLTKVFNEIGLLGIGAAVWRAHYDEALASGKWKKMQFGGLDDHKLCSMWFCTTRGC
jgi:hypothetical protein